MSLIESIVSALPWRGRSHLPAAAARERRASPEPHSASFSAAAAGNETPHGDSRSDAHAGLHAAAHLSGFLRTTPHSDRCRPAAYEAGSDFLRPSMRSRCPA